MSLDVRSAAAIDAAATRIAAQMPPLTAHQMEVIAVAFNGRGSRAHHVALARSTFTAPAPVEGARG
ncbi:hypothetical protein [Promicromonospora soli]